MSRRRTEFRARFTGDIPIASGGAASAAKPLVNEKNDQSPDVRSGRQKAWYQYIASLSVTPTSVGVPVSFWVVRVVPPATLTRVALHHLYDEILVWYTPQASAKMLAGCFSY